MENSKVRRLLAVLACVWASVAYADQASIVVPETGAAWDAAHPATPPLPHTFENTAKFFINPTLKSITSNFSGNGCGGITSPVPWQWCVDTLGRTISLYTAPVAGTPFQWRSAFTINSDGTLTSTSSTGLQAANNLSDVSSTSTARTNLGALPSNNPSFTGTMTATDGGGYFSGTNTSGGFFFAQGNGVNPASKPQYDWFNFGANTNEAAWGVWADTASLHFSAANDAFSTYNDFMTVSRVAAIPSLALNFATDAQGAYPQSYAVNNVSHFGGASVDGIKFGAGGQTWGYLVNTQKGTGWNVPQLYVSGFPFGPTNIWGAPILINNTTTTGNNRGIGIIMTDTSTTGTLQATGIEIQANTPPDRGGDTSAMYIKQTGGGNGISLYKLSSTFPDNGFALEARSDGTATAVWGSVLNGDAFHVEVTGPSGNGLNIYPKLAADGGTATLSNRAIKVRDFANTSEKFTVLMDGTVFSNSTGTFNGGITTGSTTFHTTSVALSNAAAAATATMTNAPTAGNPTKWISINDNGTTRRIPAW